ncbi:hypothetical protein [Paludibacterium sp. B53371]|uniref:hypothetical protein n=1 Tax=Paludibacterium sp. B53371 TaxID=2806263 RepID=UPI001C03EA65|nr:hypothetical protein [Paludibacterium sp. B53371]
MNYVITPLPSGILPSYDPEVLADELASACGSSYGLSTAGTCLMLFPTPGTDETKIIQVIERHLATDASDRRTKRARAAEIRVRLDQIDAESVRPLRAHIAGSATSEDEDKLKKLDVEAVVLRKELETLR